MARIRIILNGKVAGNSAVRAAVQMLRQRGHDVEIRVTWETGDAKRLTSEAVSEAKAGKAGEDPGNAGPIVCIVAGGGDGTINEVFAAAYEAGLPPECSLGVLPLGTANDFAHAAGLPIEDPAAALALIADAPARWIDIGVLDGRPFFNLVTGGFGSRVTVETDPELKKRLGGLAYVLTGMSRFAELSANAGRFRADGLAWEGRFLAVAIGNGRQAGGGVPLCPDAVIDDGMLDLIILPELDRSARLEAFARLLRNGAAAIRADLISARSAWIEFESEQPLNVNLDGEPMLAKWFRIECRNAALPVRLGDSPLISRKI
jgi:lipid kinase YegS